MAAFGLTQVQADDILEMRLRALNKLEGIRIEKELVELRDEAVRLRRLLDSESELRNLVVTELQADGSTAISALTLSGALSAAVKPKLPPWLCTTTMHGQTFCTSAS
mgnify:CR=1 FL=1